MKQKPILSLGLTLLLTACLTLVGCTLQPAPPASTATPTQSPTHTEQQEESVVEQMLIQNGLTDDALTSRNCRQLVVVKGEGTKATLSFYENREGKWVESTVLQGTGCVGKNGMTTVKAEGDKATPTGLYPIGDCFYQTLQPPNTRLDTFPLKEGSYWVDDPNSIYYNAYVEGEENKDWNSAERMWEIPGYEYGFVIGYNASRTKGAGSAIFFHIGENYTAGCVATNKELVLSYLEVLDKQQNPYILLIPQ